MLLKENIVIVVKCYSNGNQGVINHFFKMLQYQCYTSYHIYCKYIIDLAYVLIRSKDKWYNIKDLIIKSYPLKYQIIL